MNVKRPLVALAALVMLSTVFASAPVAASQEYCDVQQTNSQANLLNVNSDTNVNAVNAAANAPILSPNVGDGDQSAEANQVIEDNNDDFQSQSNNADC